MQATLPAELTLGSPPGALISDSEPTPSTQIASFSLIVLEAAGDK